MALQTLDDPFVGVVAVTLDTAATSKSAANGYSGRPRGLIVGVAGNVAAVFQDGSSAVIPLTAGVHRLAISQINTTSTTATGLFYLY